MGAKRMEPLAQAPGRASTSGTGPFGAILSLAGA